MFVTIFLILLLVASASVLGWLFWRKWSQLQLLDPESLPDAQTRKLKYDILRQRVSRTSDKYVKKAHKDVVGPIGRLVQVGFRKVAGKLTAAERSYQKKKRQTGAVHVDKETIRTMLQEAKELLDKSEWDRAEKILIEIISTNPRHVEACERLGRLYFQKKEYDQALETWSYLNKLVPDDPSVLAALGEVEDIRGNMQESRSYFEQAVALRPSNPRYLDFYIDVLIKLEDVHDAMTTLDRLREANPENKKIEVFEKRIEEVRTKASNG
ncbi:tetratricopeptide repeat protein [Candidatus Uhrbacteria bacterium]|mgnify:CR=1 FL=1|jgi:tetratricopeptide (TPR) repeat protein|nr:tetratricopeptide repeat protein [Candidatus Uhrbacteria bacterium]